ncbi:unnamed protein product [Ilex paraguariensis]|uniref:Cytochrome P450 n=1 Tax=Ilex paraguariensis TaxID=185542 RepID=A0ABC8TRF9_9AQUA
MENNRKKTTPPEASGAWPVIGHLHLLGGSKLIHKTLGSMADKYGPIFTIKLGVHNTLVVSDCNIAKESYTTKDKVFADRPKSVAAEVMGYNYAMFGLGPYGPYWRHVRKVVVIQLLSKYRLEMLGHIRVSEVKTSIKEIYEIWLTKRSTVSSNVVMMEMKEWFGNLTLNILMRMVVGKRYSGDEEEGGRTKKAIREYFELTSTSMVADAIPFLRWLDLGGHEKAMKHMAKEMDIILEGWLKEHKNKRNSRQLEKDEQDFMDVVIQSVLDDTSAQGFSSFDDNTIIKATCLVRNCLQDLSNLIYYYGSNITAHIWS